MIERRGLWTKDGSIKGAAEKMGVEGRSVRSKCVKGRGSGLRG